MTMFIIMCGLVIAGSAGWLGYWRGRLRGTADTIDMIQKPALEFIDVWYPLGVPVGPPRNAIDVIAQVLEPLTKL